MKTYLVELVVNGEHQRQYRISPEKIAGVVDAIERFMQKNGRKAKTVSSCMSKINKLTDPATFHEDVRQIIGYYDHYFWEDWEIKKIERLSDKRYSEIA